MKIIIFICSLLLSLNCLAADTTKVVVIQKDSGSFNIDTLAKGRICVYEITVFTDSVYAKKTVKINYSNGKYSISKEINDNLFTGMKGGKWEVKIENGLPVIKITSTKRTVWYLSENIIQPKNITVL